MKTAMLFFAAILLAALAVALRSAHNSYGRR